MTDAREIRALLEDRPDLEPALESLLETDDAHETWTFDDTGLDSGTFGELVSESVVEKVDGEYRLPDPTAVERALSDDVPAPDDESRSFSLPSTRVDSRVAGAVLGVLSLVFTFRMFSIDAVFRNGQVVLSGNDAYFYLYLVEELTRVTSGPFDLSALTAAPMQGQGEPLLVAVLWFVAGLLGGIKAVPGVLAWYPVVAGVASGLFTYLLATGLTDDERVGIAAVAMLAVMPVLSFRSGLGFADHHAFDYVWLTLTAAAAVRLARTAATRAAVTDRRTLAWAGIAGAAITGQLMAWEGGPLLLFALVLYVPLAGLIAVDQDESPGMALAPFGLAFGVAALLSGGAHLAIGWQSGLVAFAPVYLLIGVVGVAAVGEAVQRAPDLPTSETRTLAAVEVACALVGFGLLTTALSPYGDRLFEQLQRVATNQSIAEANSLFSAGTFGWLFLFGFLMFLGVPYIGWALLQAIRGADRQRWLVSGLYGAFFLVLSAFQMRFAGELSAFLAVFAGLGFVHIAERVELARPPVPFRSMGTVRGDGGESGHAFELPDARSGAALLFLFLLVSGLSIVQAPVKAEQATIPSDTYETAVWIDNYAEQEGMEYPENYVFSEWGRNRVYNYYVNGQSRSYGFAKENFREFSLSENPDTWYDRLQGKVGFIVFARTQSSEATTYHRLTGRFGSYYDGFNGTGHYRAVYITKSHQVHQLVPGANVTGRITNESGPRSNATVYVQTRWEITGQERPYVRRTFTNHDGTYHVRVAYPGEYTVILPDSNTTRTVTVSEAAVENGERVDAGLLQPDGNTTDDQARLATPAYQVSPS